MKNRKIGHIISKGGNVEDIQKVVQNFPSKPTEETFVELGYARSTAKRYCSLLEKNISSKESITEGLEKSDLMKVIQSDNADYDNILVDTCALNPGKCIDIIEKAKHVTFIFSSLEEMDRKQKEIRKMKKATEEQEKLAQNIAKYTSKMLEFPNKYMISKFKGYPNEGYVDNILLQYLEILPKQIRPTLLTEDRNLATKALALGLDYIFVDKNKIINAKKLSHGIFISKRNDELYIFNKGTFKFEIHRDGDIIPCAAKVEIKVEHGDVLHVYEKKNSKTIEHIINI